MNKKAFTLVELLAVIVVLAIVLAIAIPSITSLIEGSKTSAYLANEKMLSKAANTYLSLNEENYPTDSAISKVIQLDNLVADKYITNIKDISNSSIECEGYVLVKTDGNNIVYNPYIKCGSNYETVGFSTDLLSASEALNVDVLIVAGGGGGSSHNAGGGGAGGLTYLSNYNINSNDTINVTVGNGGLGDTNQGPVSNATNGENSIFGDFLIYGGGSGGCWNGTVAKSGGSGGGAGCHESINSPAGSGFDGQGFSGGGSRNNALDRSGGGGGGAGGIGEMGQSTRGGNGGIGLYFGDKFSNNLGDEGWFAGGGGGANRFANETISGLGGKGGGGNGRGKGDTLNANNGMPNTGGGGGAKETNNAVGTGLAGSGGSGIVVVRYPGSVALATGGTVNTTLVPGYVVHTFTTSGTFIVQ